MSTADILRAARVRIERGWCQRASARSARGRKVKPWSQTAVKWCAIGSIQSIPGGLLPCSSAAKFLSSAIANKSVFIWNDEWNRTKAEVLAAFGRAIQLAECAR